MHGVMVKDMWREDLTLEKPNPPWEAQIQSSFDLPETPHVALVERYLHLTRIVMPALARTTKLHWPVRNDHCFQRIVLDTICGGVWYDHIPRPAYQHLDETEAMRAVLLCEQIISGETDLSLLNRRSMNWRGKGSTVSIA